MKHFTEEDLDQLQALYNEATEGPWQATTSYPAYVSFHIHGNMHEKLMDEVYAGKDAAFIAAAYNTFPSLIAQLRTARQENTRLVIETHNWSAAVKKLEAERATRHPATTGAAEAVEALHTWPEAIYLQVDDEAAEDGQLPNYNTLEEVSWCSDQVCEHDVKYVRADLLRTTAPAASEAPAEAPLSDRDRLGAEAILERAAGHEYVMASSSLLTRLMGRILSTPRTDG